MSAAAGREEDDMMESLSWKETGLSRQVFKVVKSIERANSSREEEREAKIALSLESGFTNDLERALCTLYVQSVSPQSLSRAGALDLGLVGLRLMTMPKGSTWGRPVGYQALNAALDRLGTDTADGRDLMLLASNTLYDHLTSDILGLMHLALNFCASTMTVDTAKVILPGVEECLACVDPCIQAKACRVLSKILMVYPKGLSLNRGMIEKVLDVTRRSEKPAVVSSALRLVLQILPLQDPLVAQEVAELLLSVLSRFIGHCPREVHLRRIVLQGLFLLHTFEESVFEKADRAITDLEDWHRPDVCKDLLKSLSKSRHHFTREKTISYLQLIKVRSPRPSAQQKAVFLVLMLALLSSPSALEHLRALGDKDATLKEFQQLALVEEDSTVQLNSMRILVELGQSKDAFEESILGLTGTRALETFWNWQIACYSGATTDLLAKLLQTIRLVDSEESTQTAHCALDRLLHHNESFSVFFDKYLDWCDAGANEHMHGEIVILLACNLICLHRSQLAVPMVERWANGIRGQVERLIGVSARCSLAHLLALISALAIHPMQVDWDAFRHIDLEFAAIVDRWQALSMDDARIQEILGPKRTLGLEDLREAIA